jgi:hypothetical protein
VSSRLDLGADSRARTAPATLAEPRVAETRRRQIGRESIPPGLNLGPPLGVRYDPPNLRRKIEPGSRP